MVGGGSPGGGTGGGPMSCPKCKSTNIMPTGKSENRQGVLCVEYICNDCGHKWWVSIEKLKCPSCGSLNIEPTGNIKYEKSVMFIEYVCKKCGYKWWRQKDIIIPRCPKCFSEDIVPTGEAKSDKNFIYIEWMCNSCGHKWWVLLMVEVCPVCHSPIKSEVIGRKKLEGGYTEVKTKHTCTNPNCTGTFQGEVKTGGD